MKRDRGIDYPRVRHKPGLGFCSCKVCRDLWDRQNAGEDVGVEYGHAPEGCEHVNWEYVFASHWEMENDPRTIAGDLLAKLFAGRLKPDFGDDESIGQQMLFENDPGPVLSRREHAVAATVIQWLGTNCGWCFLRKAVEGCGYMLVESKAFDSMVKNYAESLVRKVRSEADERVEVATIQAETRVEEGLAEMKAELDLARRDMVRHHKARLEVERRLRMRSAAALGRFESLEYDYPEEEDEKVKL